MHTLIVVYLQMDFQTSHEIAVATIEPTMQPWNFPYPAPVTGHGRKAELADIEPVRLDFDDTFAVQGKLPRARQRHRDTFDGRLQGLHACKLRCLSAGQGGLKTQLQAHWHAFKLLIINAPLDHLFWLIRRR